MSTDLRRLVDLEERYLSRVPFGRNKLLRVLGIGLFSLAIQAVLPPQVARANHSSAYPCYGYGMCHCCNGDWCCDSGCTSLTNTCWNPGDGHCWFMCVSGILWHCCDFNSPSYGRCICRKAVWAC